MSFVPAALVFSENRSLQIMGQAAVFCEPSRGEKGRTKCCRDKNAFQAKKRSGESPDGGYEYSGEIY